MNEKEHFHRMQRYFERSKLGYNFFLGGAKHFGFYPHDQDINEKEAQILMQDLIAKKLGLGPKAIVLDAGCGQGIVSTFLANRYGYIIEGITVLQFEIDAANILARKLNVTDNVNFSFMDYNNLKFDKKFFDGVYTIETLSHSVDVSKTLNEFYRVLKTKGKIALFEYILAQDDEFSSSERKILERVSRGSAMDGLKDFRLDKFKQLLLKTGFKNVRSIDISSNVKPSLRRLRNWAFFPYYVFVKPFGLQERFPNVSAAVEFYKMVERGLIRYNIITANK